MRSGKEDKLEVPADNGQGIWAGSTPENLHRGAAGIKSNGTRKEKYPKTLQVWSKVGRPLHCQRDPRQWVLLPCKGGWDLSSESHKWKVAKAVLCVKILGTLETLFVTLHFSKCFISLYVIRNYLLSYVFFAKNFIYQLLIYNPCEKATLC